MEKNFTGGQDKNITGKVFVPVSYEKTFCNENMTNQYQKIISLQVVIPYNESNIWHTQGNYSWIIPKTLM